MVGGALAGSSAHRYRRIADRLDTTSEQPTPSPVPTSRPGSVDKTRIIRSGDGDDTIWTADGVLRLTIHIRDALSDRGFFVFLDVEGDTLQAVDNSVSATDDPVEATAAAVVPSRINLVRG